MLGPTVSTSPEDVVMGILQSVEGATQEQMDEDNYPLLALEKYEGSSKLVDIDAASKGMETKYGIVLGLELVPAGRTFGQVNFPCQNVYFKVFPKGHNDFKDITMGFPSLEYKSRGLGHRVTESSPWCFVKLEVNPHSAIRAVGEKSFAIRLAFWPGFLIRNPWFVGRKPNLHCNASNPQSGNTKIV